ncbi:MAG: cytochrome c peroxidase, partial [Pseudoalteromonas tetraodonis]
MRRIALSIAALFTWLPFASEADAKEALVHIEHSYGGEPLRPDSLRYKNNAGETLSITRLSYLLSGFEIQTSDGVWHRLPEQYAWLDASKRRNRFTLAGIPDAGATALRFHVGADPKSNATDPKNLPADHPLNPNLNGLHWSWQGGYIFLAIEGHFRTQGAGETLSGYSYHFANDPNRTAITIGLTDPPSQYLFLRFNLKAILDPIHISKQGTSTHSRQGDEIAASIRKNLPAAWTLVQSPVAQNSPPTKPAPRPKYPPKSPDELYRFSFDPKFSFPNLPSDNPMTIAGVELGKKLFNDARLSLYNTVSCAACHQSESGLSDPRRFSIGVHGKPGLRNAMPLFNLAWKDTFFWDGRAPTLREQVLHPIQDPLEMNQSLGATISKLRAHADYPALFEEAFGVPGIDSERLSLALEQFLLSLTSYKSKFDLAMRGKGQLDEQEQRGFQLFFTEYEPRANQFGADCFHCHGGALFTNHGFANNGLDERFDDLGRGAITKQDFDEGKFSVPSLRNVELTA